MDIATARPNQWKLSTLQQILQTHLNASSFDYQSTLDIAKQQISPDFQFEHQNSWNLNP